MAGPWWGATTPLGGIVGGFVGLTGRMACALPQMPELMEASVF